MLDPFGSHVVRALLLLIAPSISLSVLGSANNSMRSRKSAKWKARQGPMKSVFHDGSSAAPAVAVSTPQEFDDIGRNLVFAVREELGENEVRALAADKVASPVLQLLLELESHLNLADQPGSLMDRVLVGMITMFRELSMSL
jgi:nucleolar protein 9